MTRRTPKAELEFGNDSFLDVICNVVGILIILILVAGYHVSKAPLTAEMLETLNASVSAENIVPEPAKTSAIPETPAAPPEVIPVPTVPMKPPDVPLSLELVQQRDRLQDAISGDVAAAKANQSQLSELSKAAETQQQRLELAALSVAETRTSVDGNHKQIEALAAALRESKQEVIALRDGVSKAANEKSPVKAVKHRVTPISKTVQGKEVHFRLSEGRVALVPVDELSERLRPQIERRKEMLLKYRRQEGEVGPVAGFTMHYAVEREPLSTIEEMNGGRGMVRISVSRWEIVPEPDLHTETAEQALKKGSAFLRALKMADVDATLTFWVYPDSFEIYRKLRDFAYEEGFTVAARPLPAGVPIAGSPQGSRSSGQ